MGVLVTRDPNELTRISINTWGPTPTKVIELFGETLAESIPCLNTIALSEEHVFHQESMLEIVTELCRYINDCIEDNLVPALYQTSIIRHNAGHFELFLLQHSQPIAEDTEVTVSFESVMWWDEPVPELEVELRIYELEK